MLRKMRQTGGPAFAALSDLASVARTQPRPFGPCAPAPGRRCLGPKPDRARRRTASSEGASVASSRGGLHPAGRQSGPRIGECTAHRGRTYLVPSPRARSALRPGPSPVLASLAPDCHDLCTPFSRMTHAHAPDQWAPQAQRTDAKSDAASNLAPWFSWLVSCAT